MCEGGGLAMQHPHRRRAAASESVTAPPARRGQLKRHRIGAAVRGPRRAGGRRRGGAHGLDGRSAGLRQPEQHAAVRGVGVAGGAAVRLEEGGHLLRPPAVGLVVVDEEHAVADAELRGRAAVVEDVGAGVGAADEGQPQVGGVVEPAARITSGLGNVSGRCAWEKMHLLTGTKPEGQRPTTTA